MAYIGFCLEEMKECRNRSSNVTRERDLVLATSYASRPLLKYVLSHGFGHLGHLGSGNAAISKDMVTLQGEIRRHAWEWDRLCKLVPSIRSGIPWASSEHDFIMYTLVAFASNALFHTFLGRSTLTPREGTNPLIYAVHFGKLDHARALIFGGANVNDRGLVVDKLAAENLAMDVDGSDADDSDSIPSTADSSDERKAMPIEVAVDHWHVEMVDLLLVQGSTIPDGLLTRVLRVEPHQFPLSIIHRLVRTAEFVQWAATPWDNRRLLELFVEDEEYYEQIKSGDELMLATNGLVQAGCAEALLLVAVEKGCIPVIRTLLSMNTSLPSDMPLVSHLCGKSSIPMQKRSLRFRVTIVDALAANGDTPLHVAVRLSDESRCLIITKLLVEAGCSPRERDADDKPPIYAAVVRGFVSVVEYLLSQLVPLPSRILFIALQSPVMKRVEMIRLLVGKGANVHVLNPDGDSLLHSNMRSRNGSVCLEIAQILIDIGCDPLVSNLCGEIPLHIAAKQGYDEVVNYLLLFSSSLDVSSLLKTDPAGQIQILRSLLGYTSSLRSQLKEGDRVFRGDRPFMDDEDQCLKLAQIFIGVADDYFARISGSEMFLDIATRRGFKVVEFLASKAVPSSPAILFTALRHQVSVVFSLIRNGASLHVRDDNGDTLLHVAMSILTEAECRTTTELLVEAGCNPFTLNNAKMQPIRIAASRGFVSVVEYLLIHALDAKVPLPLDLPNRDCLSLLFVILKSTHPNESKCLRTIRLLFKAGCVPTVLDGDRETPLHIAISRGFTSIVDYLLSQDVPLPSGILFFALQTQYPYNGATDNPLSIMSSLVRKGADVHARDPDQNSLIQVAVTLGRSSVVEYLLSYNAPFPPDILLTVLQHTSSPRIVSLFVEHGADVSAISADGDTVLHVALARQVRWLSDGRQVLGVVDVLMKAGCNRHARDAKGRTPLELATAKGHYDVAMYLMVISLGFDVPSFLVSPRPPLQNPGSPPGPPGFRPHSLSPASLPHVTPSPHCDPPCPPPLPAIILPPPPPLSQRLLLRLGDVQRVISGLFTPSGAQQTECEALRETSTGSNFVDETLRGKACI